MKLLRRVAGSPFWYLALPGGKRVSTKCQDEKAARLVAAQIERAQALVEILKDDTDGTLARIISEHLYAKGCRVKDKAPGKPGANFDDGAEGKG